MKMKPVRSLGVALLVFASIVVCVSAAQPQRRRASRRVTNPVRARTTPTPDSISGEPSVVSTADDRQEESPRRTTRRPPRDTQSAPADTQRVRELTTQVEQLNGQLNQMKNDQRALYDLERLTRAEQRAEDLRTQLREVTDKEFQYQERIGEIEYESQPDSIQRRAALVGTLNPSAVRDAIAQQLERERARIQKQLELLGASHARLEASVASADAEVERLRQRVEAADQQQSSSPPPAADNSNGGNASAAPQPTPTPAAQPPE
jgi:DNA repair exonuclease SbcCD ATPase subunit